MAIPQSNGNPTPPASPNYQYGFYDWGTVAIDDSDYEIVPYCDAVPLILKHSKQSIQETLDKLRSLDHYLVRKKKKVV